MFFFFFYFDDKKKKLRNKLPRLVTERMLNTRVRQLARKSIICQVQKLSTGNYIVACGGYACCDGNGVSAETAYDILGTIGRLLKNPLPPDAQARLNDKAVVSKISKKDLVSETLFSEWQKSLESPKAVFDPADFTSYATKLCDACGVSIPAGKNSRELVEEGRDLYWTILGINRNSRRDYKLSIESFEARLAPYLFYQSHQIAANVSEQTADYVFGMFIPRFSEYWAKTVVRELDVLKSGDDPPHKQTTRIERLLDSDGTVPSFDKWVRIFARRTRDIFLAARSMASIVESLGESKEFVESSMQPFSSAIRKMTPLEWRLANCLMKIENLKH